jgi:putative transposase
VINDAVRELTPLVGTKAACALVGRARATHYRACRPDPRRPRPARAAPVNKLTDDERAQVLDVLRHPQFVDKAPAQVWATLLDEGSYLCSESTMYRLLREHGELRERRAQAAHPAKVKPELVATAPGQVFTWDITKLKGPARGEYYQLYVMLDIFSRYAVGWAVHPVESATLATAFIDQVVATHGAPQVVHADRGTSMTSKPLAALLADLGITQSHSRPHVSNDNPYSEAQFKTLKYCPAFPGRFGSLADARAFCQTFFSHYNHVHRHKAIGLHTPASVHYGTAPAIRAGRAVVLDAAYQRHPARFAKPPVPPKLPTTAWINQPVPAAHLQTA